MALIRRLFGRGYSARGLGRGHRWCRTGGGRFLGGFAAGRAQVFGLMGMVAFVMVASRRCGSLSPAMQADGDAAMRARLDRRFGRAVSAVIVMGFHLRRFMPGDGNRRSAGTISPADNLMVPGLYRDRRRCRGFATASEHVNMHRALGSFQLRLSLHLLY